MNNDKPVIVVSKCIEFESCRYNGLMISSEFVRSLKPLVKFIPVCPEVEIGLGVPRDPIRIIEKKGTRKLVQPSTGMDVTSRMNRFIQDYLSSLGEVHGFILKDRSPSCGINNVKVYPGIEKKSPIGKRAGFFGEAVKERFPGYPVETEGRLNNFRLREHFLTAVFFLSAFEKAVSSGRMRDLVGFHTRSKLLLMAYNQKELRELGRITANPGHDDFKTAAGQYREHLLSALKSPPRYTSNINVLMHALGYFSKKLGAGEKAFFLDTLERYRSAKIPLSACLQIIRSWIIRFDEEYLAKQVYFEPYPEELVEITDSGKGRKM